MRSRGVSGWRARRRSVQHWPAWRRLTQRERIELLSSQAPGRRRVSPRTRRLYEMGQALDWIEQLRQQSPNE